MDHVTVHIRQAELAALESVGEPFVVDSKQVENGGLEVMHMNSVFCHVDP